MTDQKTDETVEPETGPKPARRRRAAPKAEPEAPVVETPKPADHEPWTAGLMEPMDDETVELPDGRTMSAAEYLHRSALLVAPFPVDQIEKLPKPVSRDDRERYQCRPGTKASADDHHCGGYHVRSVHLDYVGHAGITSRLLEADPLWDWDFMLKGPNGEPVYTDGGLWITLTVLGVTRKGYGDASGKSGPNAVKELIGDALRNAAMRFGVATYLWSKSGAAAILKAGGSLDEEPKPQEARQQPEARGTGRQSRGSQNATQAPAPQAQQPSVEATPEMRAQAAAIRDAVVQAADGFEAGDDRDDVLRGLWERAETHGVVDLPVDLPVPWDTEGVAVVPLRNLIGGARRVTIRSGEKGGDPVPATAPNMDDDPWATDAPNTTSED